MRFQIQRKLILFLTAWMRICMLQYRWKSQLWVPTYVLPSTVNMHNQYFGLKIARWQPCYLTIGKEHWTHLCWTCHPSIQNTTEAHKPVYTLDPAERTKGNAIAREVVQALIWAIQETARSVIATHCPEIQYWRYGKWWMVWALAILHQLWRTSQPK